MNYFLSYYKAKAYTFGINFLSVFQESEKLKQFILVFGFYSDSRINYRNLKVVLLIIMDYSYMNLNTSRLSKFKSISQESKKNLHQALFVTNYYWIIH